MLLKIARFVSGERTKWITLIVWVVIVGVLSAMWPGVNQMEKNNAANLEADNPSVRAAAVAEEQFPDESGIPALIVWSREGGLSDTDYEGIRRLSASLADQPVPGQQSLPPFDQIPPAALKQQASEDGTAFVMPVFFAKSADSALLKEGGQEIRNQAEAAFGADPFAAGVKSGELFARISGPAGISIDASSLFSSADVSLMIATVLLVLVLLLLIYRSPTLAIIPLIAVGFAYMAASPILGKLAELGWITVDSQAISIMTVLLFGAGTDYCLFLISHFRDRLKQEKSKSKALLGALKDASGAIAMSGFTVVIALLVLLLAKYGAVHRFAVPFSLSILVMALASLTLVPALLAIFGRASFYPFVPRTAEMEEERSRKRGGASQVRSKTDTSKFGVFIGNLVTKRPWLVVIVALILLGAAALNTFRIQYTVDLLSSFPEDSPSREGFAVIGEKFTPGELAPMKIMIDTEGQDVALKEALVKLPYLSKVSDPVSGEGDPDITAFDAEFTMNPYSAEAVNLIPELRETAETALRQAGISSPESKVWISGQTATQYDTEMTNNRDDRVVIPIVIGLIAILLLVYLRSLVAMIYLILTVVLSYFAALGLGWVAVHDLMGTAAIQGLIPLYSFVFLVALGEDYNIFLISSIWKKRKTMPLKQAIREGVAETGSVITSAGLILAGTFAVLATLPIQALVQFGIITAIGVLLDTFIVRPLLVPAITTLLGNWAFFI
ncbi:MMPL family transporter [Paenibacillus sp. M1]|uniref:MMPL family transporter n=1 Tax=Paenibacillus haidiansis TaxID=1574488 RepID=A0ABU7VVT8_9BACL